MKLSGYLCLLISAAYVSAAPVAEPEADNSLAPRRSREDCQNKCKVDQERMAKHCDGIESGFGGRICSDVADWVKRPKAQENCIFYCQVWS